MGHAREIAFTLPTQTAEAPKLIDYVSAATLAQLFDVSEATIWEWTRKGILPRPGKIGGVTRWKYTEVENRVRWGANEAPTDPILDAARGKT
jgi:predicted DNA-binding transcriptional regulator AlpA